MSTTETLETRTLLTANPIADQVLVSETVSLEESPAAVAVSEGAGNGFVSVWTSFEQPGGDTSGLGVYAQRFQSDGTPNGAAFLVNAGYTAGDQDSPDVAMDSSGNFVVVWESLGQDGDGFGVYAQRYMADGTADGGVFQVNDFTAGDQENPTIVCDGSGQFMIAWQSFGQDGDGFGVYARRYAADGTPLDAGEFPVNSTTAGNQVNPSAALARNNGNFVVTWEGDVVNGEETVDVLAHVYDSSGATVRDEFVVNTSTARDQVSPEVAMDANGDFVVAWTSEGLPGSGSDVFAQRFDATGAAAGGEFRVNETTLQGQTNPSVGMDGNGDFLVTWQSSHQDEFSFGIFGRSYAADGSPLTTELQVNTYAEEPQINPSIGVNTQGKAVVLWQGLDSTHMPAVHAQRFQLPEPGQTPGPVGSEIVLSNYAALEDAPSAAAMDANGNSVVVWQSYGSDGSGLGVFGRRFDSTGVPLGDTFVVNTTTAGNQSNPDVAMDAAGNFTVVWDSADQDGDGHGIYAQRYDASGTAVGGEFEVNTTTAGSQQNAAIAMNSADGSSVIVWQGPDASESGLFAQRFDANGNAEGGEFAVNSFTDLDQVSPAVAMNASGEFVIGWVSDHRAVFDATDSEKSIFVQWYDAAGTTSGVEQLAHSIDPAAEAQEYPDVAIDGNGNFVVVWQSITQDGSGWGVYGRQFLADKTPVQPMEFQINQTTDLSQRKPSVASDPAGNFTVAWQSDGQDQSATGIVSRQYNADGTPRTDETLVNTWEAGPQILPDVAMSPSGDLGIFWSGQGTGRKDGIHGRLYQEGFVPAPQHVFYKAAGPAGDQLLVHVTAGQEVSSPSVAVIESSGDYVAAWTSFEQPGGDESGVGVYVQRFYQDGTPKSDAVLVNTDYTADDQQAPVVAVDGSGNFVVVWESVGQDGDGAGIYAQRYAADGTTIDGPFQVNTVTAGDQKSPSVAMDNAGNFVIAWQSFGQDGDGYGVFARRYDSSGTAQGATEFEVNTTTTGNQFAPSVARARSDGRFIITWEGEVVTVEDGVATTDVQVFGRLFDASGATLQSEFPVNTISAKDQVAPDVAMDSAGSFVVTWTTEGQTSSGADIYARRFNASGTGLGDDFLVNMTTRRGQENSSVAIDDNGNFLISWESSHQDGFSFGIFGQVYDSSGTALGNEFQVNTNTQGPQVRPDLSANSDGETVVVWLGLDETHHPAIHVQRYQLPQPGGEFLVGPEGEVILNNYVALEDAPASVAYDGNRNFVAVWQSYGDDGSGLGVYAQRRDRNGNTYGNAFQVAETTAGNQSHPDVAGDSAGNFVVVWQSSLQDGDGYGIFGRRYSPDGTPQGPEFQINTTTAGDQTVPSIAMNPDDGSFVVVWQSPDVDGQGIFGQRFTSAGVPDGGEFQVNSFTDLDQVSPSVSMNAAEQFVVTWVSDHRAVFDPNDTEKTIFAQWFDADGTATGDEVLVNSIQPEFEAQEHPDVAINPDGTFTIVFDSINQDGNTWGVFARQFLADKTPVQPIEFQVNQTIQAPQRYSSIVSDAAGNFVIAWQSSSQDASGPGVYARVYDSNAVPQTAEFLVPTADEGPQINPVMSMRPNGDFVVAWTGHGVDRVEGVHARLFNIQGLVRVRGPQGPVREGNDAVYTVTLDPAPSDPVTVVLSLNDGTATLASSDFDAISAPGTVATVTFAPGEVTKQVAISTNRDGIREPVENFSLSAVSVVGAGLLSPVQSETTATAMIAGATLQIAAVQDQTVAAGTGPVDVNVAASSSDDNPAVLTTGALPAYVSFTDHGDGTGTFTIDPASGDIGSGEITLTATDSNGSVDETFMVNVVTADTYQRNTVVRRINAGGGAIANFQQDSFANVGNLYPTSAAIDVSQVPGVPAGLFQTTRWDSPGGPELNYSIPVTPGDYQVNLYFAEIFSPLFTVGGRVFDVSIEGNLMLDNFDVFAAAGGGNRGIVRSFNVTSDGTIDINFGHVVENPDIMGIEIIDRSTVTNKGPILHNLSPVTVPANSMTSVQVAATDADGDPISLSTSTLPSFASFVDHGDGTGTILLNPSAIDDGSYPITVQAMSGSQPLNDSASFVLTVPASGGNPGGTDSPIGGSVTNGGTVTATDGVRIDGPAESVQEGGTAVFTISLDAVPTETVSVLLKLEDGTATLASGDYSPLTYDGFQPAIQFAPGEQVKQVSINVNRDSVSEVDETFSLTIVDVLGTTIDIAHRTATATIAGSSMAIAPTPDQTIAAGTGPVSVIVAASSTDGSPAMLASTMLPSYASFVDNGDGTATITFDPSSGDIGLEAVSFTAADSNTSSTGMFNVTVVAAHAVQLHDSIIRINSGDGVVGSFGADRFSNPGFSYTTPAAIDLSDPSVPAGTSAAIFQSTRWDAPGGAELNYNIPVAPGDYEVRLYFAEIFGPTSVVGGRVFNVTLEGQTVLDNFDVFAEVGGNKGLVKTFLITTADANIDIDFGHIVENPDIMAIEIIDRKTTLNTGPVVAPVPAQMVATGGMLTIPVGATDLDEGDAVTLDAFGLPPFATFQDNGDGTGLISVNPDNGDVGDYPISIQATSGSQSLTDLTAFQLAVEDLMGP